ncbi:MAG: AraC family transcriptional regulator [Verrucomicrobia bacterium]|nr:AraC family transcriptional regulator [Verrucomicrobiota bacterium]
MRIPALSLNDCRRELIWANERVVEPQYLDANLEAEHVSVAWLVLRGSVEIYACGETTIVDAGRWVFVRKCSGRQLFLPETKILSVRFRFQDRVGGDLLLRNKSVVLNAVETPELERSARGLVKAMSAVQVPPSGFTADIALPIHQGLALDAAFNEWLAVYCTAMFANGISASQLHTVDPRIRGILNLLDQHSFSKRLVVSDLAKHCGLGINRFGVLFKQSTGKSAHVYFDHLRLQRAQVLLQRPEHSIKEITWELGFGSPQHFSNWFKLRTGKSPADFRQTSLGQT